MSFTRRSVTQGVLASAGLAALPGCSGAGNPPPRNSQAAARAVSNESNTYDKQTVLGAATGVFGAGAEGLATLIERAFADYGRPNAYIVGQEGSGAVIVGLRYGNGTLYHKVEGEQPVHWTGPSVGFDLGGDASKVFTLVYQLYDTELIYQRFPSIEGKVYFVGGFTMNYHQSNDIILAPIHLGAGWRLGANIGYLHYTKKRTFIPL